MPPDTSVFVAPGMRAVARAVLGKIRVRVDGVENVPASGPALLGCRHHHHLYDGAALVLAIRRPVRMIVGLDWVKDQGQRAYMEALCAIAGWPVVLRDETEGNPWGDGYRTSERRRYARAALTQSVDVLRRGGVLAMFPEGYPEIDPAGTAGSDAVRPFAPGYLSIAVRAGRGGRPVPLVPAGFSYAGPPDKPESIALRFGAPESIASVSQRASVGRSVEAKVRALSA